MSNDEALRVKHARTGSWVGSNEQLSNCRFIIQIFGSHYRCCQGILESDVCSTCSWLGWAVFCVCRVGPAAGKHCLLWLAAVAGVAGAGTVCQKDIMGDLL